MEREIWDIINALDNNRLSAIDAHKKLCVLYNVSGINLCPECHGQQYFSGHANHPHPDGDCLGQCPIQIQCEFCEGKGTVTNEKIKQFNIKKQESSPYKDLPF